MRASATNHQSESELQGSQRAVPGIYHVVCKDGGAKENPAKKDGTLLGASLVECEVLAGTVPGQEGKDVALFLRFDKEGNPSEQHVRFFMASGLLPPGTERDIDFENETPGCQLIVALEEYTDRNGKKQVSVKDFGMAMFHVDSVDAEVRDVPRSREAMDLIPAERRRQGGNGGTAAAAVAAASKPPANGNGAKAVAGGTAPAAAPAASAPAASAAKVAAANDFSDL